MENINFCSRGIHICQPDNNKSCAACCGIYNFIDNSLDAVFERLGRNSLSAGMSDLSMSHVKSHSKKWRKRDNDEQSRLFPVIFNCEFAGFIDKEKNKAGCLLHPCIHGDTRFIEIGFHGVDMCLNHFCPSYFCLTEQEKLTVILSIDHWFLYGLVITDIDIVKCFVDNINNSLGNTFDPWLIARSQDLKNVFADFFSFKLNWPFADSKKRLFGKYRFYGDEYEINTIPYEKLGIQKSVYTPIFLSLASFFNNSSEVIKAENIIKSHVQRAVAEINRMCVCD